MKKISNIVAALGIATGLGVTSLPVAGVFAADDAQNKSVNVQLTVQSYASLTQETTNNNPEVAAGVENTSIKTTLTAKTNSSAGYTITVKDTDTNTSLTNTTTGSTDANNSIPAVDTGTGTTGWCLTGGGISGCKGVPASSATNGLTVKDAGSNNSAYVSGENTVITYRIKSSENQVAGVYQDEIKYTITAK